MKVLVISSSPRHDGNSHLLAQAAVEGARSAGHEVEHVFLDDYVQRLFGNCRTCRLADGRCSLDDRYEDLLLNHILPADGIIYAMPLYWYGMPGRLKTVFDRLFCYISDSAPQQRHVLDTITGKKIGLLISSEENYTSATAGVVAQFQEASRYLRQELIGVVAGNGNARGEIVHDPSDPVSRARDLGARLFDIRVTDYCVDTVRPKSVWGALTGCPAAS